MRLVSAICFGIAAVIGLLYGVTALEDSESALWVPLAIGFIGLGGLFLALSESVWPPRR